VVFALSALTLVATALSFHVISRPQIALNLAARVTYSMTWLRNGVPLLPFPPPQLSQGPQHSLS
jgi:hypothetical protein